jgi:serine O-acetyltransferase
VSATVNHRLAHELYRLGAPLLPRMMSELAHSIPGIGIDIRPGARIGEQFFIDHASGVVIGETAVIGVVIYAGATVLGRITIGRGSTGRNVWVTEDVPAGSHITQAKIRHEDQFEGGAGS